MDYKIGKVYWWKAYEGERVPVRFIQDFTGYVSVRILSISVEAAIRTTKGAGELVHLDKRSAPLEEII